MIIRHCFAAMLLVGIAVPRLAHAAQSYDNCTGTIPALPATISTQGVWCLKKDLSTDIASGDAITIATNNVTIDCNDFKLGGLAAGDASQAIGIYASTRQNVTVRHCNIRGFKFGIFVSGGAGHLVEDNRLDNNLYAGIAVTGDHGLVRRNRVYDTGGASGASLAFGIDSSADITDNIVSGLLADQSNGVLVGIASAGVGTRVSGNVVSGFDMTATQGGAVAEAVGIGVSNMPMAIVGNTLFGAPGSGSHGIYGDSAASNFCADNIVYGFGSATAMSDCSDDGGNGLQ
jgi:parallel beta-helix repeat protein